MIKIVLKKRKEYGTYLATARRHRWRLKMTMKNDRSNVACSWHCGLHQQQRKTASTVDEGRSAG